MAEKQSRVWSDSGTEPNQGAEPISGGEKYPAEYMNWAIWALTTDVDTLFSETGDLEAVDGVTSFTFDTEANRPADADLVDPDDDGWMYFEIDTGRVFGASGGTWHKIGVSQYQQLDERGHGMEDHDETVASSSALSNHTSAASAHGSNGEVAGMGDLYTDEQAQDTIAALLQAGSNITLSYDDANNTLTIDTSALDKEEVEDAVAALLGTGTNLTVGYDDANDTLTLGLANDISVTSLDAESASVTQAPQNDADVMRLADRYSNNEAQSAVEGNVDAADLTGNSGSAGAVLKVDSNGDTGWQSADGFTESEARDVSIAYGVIL